MSKRDTIDESNENIYADQAGAPQRKRTLPGGQQNGAGQMKSTGSAGSKKKYSKYLDRQPDRHSNQDINQTGASVGSHSARDAVLRRQRDRQDDNADQADRLNGTYDQYDNSQVNNSLNSGGVLGSYGQAQTQREGGAQDEGRNGLRNRPKTASSNIVQSVDFRKKASKSTGKTTAIKNSLTKKRQTLPAKERTDAK